MAQRMESFKDHLRPVLTVGATRAQNERKPHPSHKRGSPHRHRAPLKSCEKTQGFMRFPTFKHHLDKAFEAAIPMQNASLDHQTQCHSACNLSKITSAALTMGTARAQNARKPPRRTNEVPPIDAGSHFMRENTRFRAISNPQTSPGQSAPSGSRGA